MSRQRVARGYNVIELIVVVALIGVLVVIAAPLFLHGALLARQLEGAADRVMSDLRRAQSLAVTNGGMARLNYNAGTYRIETSADNGATWAAFGSSTWYDPGGDYRGVALASVRDNNTTDLSEVRFDSRGSARSTPVVAQFPITLRLVRGGDVRSVLVQRTGSVRSQ